MDGSFLLAIVAVNHPAIVITFTVTVTPNVLHSPHHTLSFLVNMESVYKIQKKSFLSHEALHES